MKLDALSGFQMLQPGVENLFDPPKVGSPGFPHVGKARVHVAAKGVTPGIILGVLSLIVLLVAIVALYVKHLEGGWRGIYVVSAILAFYFNFFVLIAQSFDKVPVLHSFAPTQASPGYGFTQAAVLVVFILLTIRAYKKFHPQLDVRG